ncbi:methyltransferase (plasmid) [Streptomyces sp. NBC_00390]|uniref:class I SAM-dependent methyltransferase n=1 Tax=Streptomyces sp. NBC_00390 TaxID=2975736 RepID=UPI002E1B9960
MLLSTRRTAVMRAGVELRVFDGLADGPAGADELAKRLGVHPRGMRVLLAALAAIGLLDVEDDAYRLAPGAEEVLVTSSPAYFGSAMRLASSDYEWQALGRLADAVRSGGTVLDENAETPEYSYWEDFAAYPTGNTSRVAAKLADLLADWATERPCLDVLDTACGHGYYGYTLAQRFPQAKVWDIDWANVLDVSVRHAERMGVRDRVELITGDMFSVPMGGPYDVTMITNVLHHFSEERATEMLTKLAQATKPDGKVAVVAITTDDRPPAEDPVPHLFSVLMLAWTHEGESHSMDAYRRMFAAAGLTPPRFHSLPGVPLRILLAERA